MTEKDSRPVRIDNDYLEELAVLHEEVNRKSSDVRVNKANVLRMVLRRGIDALRLETRR